MSAARPSYRPSTSNPRGRHLLIWAVVVVVVLLLIKTLLPHENRYEKIARDVTVALQRNDIDAVRKLQNVETATDVTRGIVGRAADILAPLGAIKSVKENTPPDDGVRVHEFDITFANGKIHEKFKLDPDNKIVRFAYQKTPA